MRTLTLVVCMAVVASVLNSALADDTITLKSGEVLRGRILSDSVNEITIEVPNANRTIFSKRSINKTDIKDSTLQDKAERVAFEAMLGCKLDQNQESTSNQCLQVLARAEEFLAKHSKSEHCPEVRVIQDRWQTELREVTAGRVKLQGQWMTLDEKSTKQPLISAKQKVEEAKRGLESVRLRRTQLIKDIATAEQNQRQAAGYVESARNNPVRVPVYRTVIVREGFWGYTTSGARIYHEQITRQEFDHDVTRPNPELPKFEQSVSFYSGQIVSGKRELSGIDGRITEAERRVVSAETAYTKAEADYNQLTAVAPSSPQAGQK